MTRRACLACGSTSTSPAFNAGGNDFLRCGGCRSVFETEPLTKEELWEFYEGPDYFRKDPDSAEDQDNLYGYPDDYIGDQAHIEEKFDGIFGHLERYAEPGRLLDIGCGPGFLLTVARRRGWDAVGIDLNEWSVEFAKDLGLDARATDLSDAGFDDAEFDAVTIMDVIEHVPDTDELLEQIARVLKPGGALAVLTPDAGSPVSRALGKRWPEVRRPGEHTILFSVDGLAAALARHGFAACGWHSIGKTTSIATLLADVAPVAPAATARARALIADREFGHRTMHFDPRTKFTMYARRLPDPERAPSHRPARIPRKPEKLAQVDDAIIRELEDLEDAERFCDWAFAQFSEHVRGDVAEVGAGIGTFSERLLRAGAETLTLIEPFDGCADALEARFAGDERVSLFRESLPYPPSLTPSAFDLIACQNVIEHVGDDGAAVETMAAALKPGGHLAIVVPHHPGLYGSLDEAFGHWRRYEPEELGRIVEQAGLKVKSLHPLNALGIAGWAVKSRLPGTRIGAGSLAVYEALVRVWRPLEERMNSKAGLSLVCVAERVAQ